MIKTTFGQLLVDHAGSQGGGGSVIHLFLAQPTPLEEKNLGRIFALIEFTDTYAFAEEVVKYLDDSFFQSYYRSADFEPEAAFERSLHKVNLAVQDIISQHGEDWVYKTNMLLGVLHHGTLYVSYSGKIEAYLAQTDTMVDIIQHQPTSPIQPLKLFNNIISGKCPEKSGVLIATSSLLDYLSLEKIRRTMQVQSAAEAVQYFESVLSEQDTLANVAAFIIKFEQSQRTAGAATTEQMDRTAFSQPGDSMEKLIDRERATGDLLTPSIWPTLKGRLKNAAAKPSAGRAPATAKPVAQSPWLHYLQLAGGVALNVLGYIGSALMLVGKKLWDVLTHLFKNRDSLSSNFGQSMRGVGGWWGRLRWPRKVFLGLFVLTVVVFGISVLRKGNHVKQDTQATQYAQTITDVQNTLGEVESKQIMKDDTGARELLAKAETALATVPKDSDSYKTNGDAIQKKISELNGILNQVTTLDQLAVVGDFGSVAAAVAVGKISQIGNNIFGFADGSDTVYRLNLSDQSVSSVITGSDSQSAFTSVKNDSAATTLAYTAKSNFVQFNPVLEKTSPVTVSLKDKVAVTDFDIFNSRLYILDAKNKSIWRADKSGDTYGKSEAWLSDAAALEKAVSFDIDGSIYVLLSDGTIKQYDAGQESDFKIDTFSPSLSGGNVIIKTDPTAPFYVLNPTTQRVVILEADGSLRQQYTHTDLAQAKDLIVDEPNQIMYVLGSNTVWSISLK